MLLLLLLVIVDNVRRLFLFATTACRRLHNCIMSCRRNIIIIGHDQHSGRTFGVVILFRVRDRLICIPKRTFSIYLFFLVFLLFLLRSRFSLSIIFFLFSNTHEYFNVFSLRLSNRFLTIKSIFSV